MSIATKEKPRLSYAAFLQQQKRSPTVAEILMRYIDAMNGTSERPGIKPLGESHECTLRVMARGPLGPIPALKVSKSDIIGYCEQLRLKLCAATVQQYMTYFRGAMNFAGSRWHDCDGVTAIALEQAKPVLKKFQLIGKSMPRKRIASDDELVRLLLYLGAQDDGRYTKIKMVPFIAAGLCTTRRRGELCRLRRGDVDWEKQTYLIRDVKHPTKKKGNHKTFALIPEFAEILKMIPVRDPNDPDELFFPYRPASVTKRYIEAKKKLGIENLRLHDNRRLAITRWLAILRSPHRVKLISGHETIQILERNYDATDPASINAEIATMERPGILSPAANRLAA